MSPLCVQRTVETSVHAVIREVERREGPASAAQPEALSALRQQFPGVQGRLGAVVHDVIVGQRKYIEARAMEQCGAGRILRERRTGLGRGRSVGGDGRLKVDRAIVRPGEQRSERAVHLHRRGAGRDEVADEVDGNAVVRDVCAHVSQCCGFASHAKVVPMDNMDNINALWQAVQHVLH